MHQPSIERSSNNFTLLRLVAAFFVLFSHSYGLLGKGLQQPGPWYHNKHLIASDIGLAIFFTISGFLVTQSLFNSNSLKHYAIKRVLRIFPALMVVNLFCIVLGLFVTTFSVHDYLLNPQTWQYFFKNTTLAINQYTLPGVFTDLRDNSVNASLWTIWIEVECYLLLLVTALTIVVRKWLFVTCFVLFEMARVYMVVLNHIEVRFINVNAVFTWGTFFYLGALYYRFKDDVPLKWFYANVLMAVALVTVFTPVSEVTEAIFFAYCILIIGTRRAVINLRGYDVSYGFYLYAFPIQQLLLHYLGYQTPVWLHIGLATLITLIPAFLSWQFIEKRFLRLKQRWQ